MVVGVPEEMLSELSSRVLQSWITGDDSSRCAYTSMMRWVAPAP